MTPVSLTPHLTPHGRLLLVRDDDASLLEAELAHRIQEAFGRGAGHGLLHLGANEVGVALPPALSFWREFAALYVTGVCTRPGAAAEADSLHIPPPASAELDQFVLAAPPMTGAEYLSAAVLGDLWHALDRAFAAELWEAKCGVEEFLKGRNSAWNLVGRVHFNLADNRKDEAAPFAFLATYTTRLSAHAKAQHVPLGQALGEYAGASNRERLLSLLLPVQRAAESCPWLKAMVDAGEIFHPLRWRPAQAMQLLRDVPQLESAGVVVRMPAVWRGNRPPRPQVTATVEGEPPSALGRDALHDSRLEAIEPNARFGEIERRVAEQRISFQEAMRMLAGADGTVDGDSDAARVEWAQVIAGPWLAETLKGLRSQEGLTRVDPGSALKGTLRPYQQVGVQWLYLLAKVGLGA